MQYCYQNFIDYATWEINLLHRTIEKLYDNHLWNTFLSFESMYSSRTLIKHLNSYLLKRSNNKILFAYIILLSFNNLILLLNEETKKYYLPTTFLLSFNDKF